MGVTASTGVASGINYDQLISSLIEMEKAPIKVIQAKQKDYQVKIAAFLDISTKLSNFKSALDSLNSSSKFNVKTASVTSTSSGDRLLTVSASSEASAGSHSIQVKKLAAANAKATQGWVDQNTTAIAPSGGTFKFKVGSGGAETSIGVTSTMTLQGLRDAINSSSTGATASIINDGTGSNPYRLILTANNSGSSNSIYITTNTTSLDLANKKVEAAYAYTTNTYSGTVASNSGNNYTGTTNKTFLTQIVTGGAVGVATYKYSADGGITWLGTNGAAYNGSNAITTTTDYTNQWIDGAAASNATNEGVKVQFSAGTLAADDKFSIDAFNPEMQAAQDAVITLDNSTITKSSNTITDVLQGVTMNLLKAEDTSSTLTLNVSSDTSGARTSIKSFVDSYNTMIKAIKDQLTYDTSTKIKNPLLGDPTLTEISRKITSTVSGAIPGLSSSSYINLSQIGITSDSKTGKLSLDESKLSAALNSKPDAVAKLFIGTATATNSAVSFISKSSTTQPGKYSIAVSAAPEKATLSGDNDLSSTGLGLNETLTFMYSTDRTASSPNYTTFSTTLSAGSTINTIVNNLNSVFATNEVGLSASNVGGKLSVTSADYGADVWFQISTDKGNDADNDQIWDAATADTLSDSGVDIVGTINSHNATGLGNVLTSTSGFQEDGLKISIDSNQTGGFGYMSVSSGVSDRLSSSLAAYTNSTSGIIIKKTDSLQKTIDDLTSQTERLSSRIASKQKRLQAQFARLEVLLGQLKSQGDFLSSQLSALSNNWSFNQR